MNQFGKERLFELNSDNVLEIYVKLPVHCRLTSPFLIGKSCYFSQQKILFHGRSFNPQLSGPGFSAPQTQLRDKQCCH